MSKTYAATEIDAHAFFADALTGVESKSIREWATSEHNRPIWVGEALAWIKAGRTDVVKFTTLIVITAMG